MIACNICNQETKYIFSAKVLNKYTAKYYQCSHCKYIQTEKPYWLKEAYSSALNIYDTGIMYRNLLLADNTEYVINKYFNDQAKFVDYAGGYGIFTRIMRDRGYDFYWTDPYAQNLLARGFEYSKQNDIELLTNFECFEHFESPLKDIEKILKISKNILFSTETYLDAIPQKNWWYLGFIHGQHISFYKLDTLRFIAKKYNLNFYTNGVSLHLLTNKNLNIQENELLKPRLSFSKKIGLQSIDLINKYIIKNEKNVKSRTLTDHEMLIHLNSK